MGFVAIFFNSSKCLVARTLPPQYNNCSYFLTIAWGENEMFWCRLQIRLNMLKGCLYWRNYITTDTRFIWSTFQGFGLDMKAI